MRKAFQDFNKACEFEIESNEQGWNDQKEFERREEYEGD